MNYISLVSSAIPFKCIQGAGRNSKSKYPVGGGLRKIEIQGVVGSKKNKNIGGGGLARIEIRWEWGGGGFFSPPLYTLKWSDNREW